MTVTIHDSDGLAATVTEVDGCAPNGTARIVLSGGTGPYDGPGDPIGTENTFSVTGLNGGPNSLTYTDSNGCTTEVLVTIPDQLTINSIETSPSNCYGTGSVDISITGGVAPYIGINGVFSNDGNFFYDNLPIGDYVWTFIDSEGCIIEADFTIEPQPTVGCEPFTFNRSQDDNTANLFYQETFLSEGTAQVFVSFLAQCVPDSIVISINGTEIINIAAGKGGCETPLDQNVYVSFCVDYCDLVEFTVYYDICNDLHNCSFPRTAWDLIVTCEQGCEGSNNKPNVGLINRSSEYVPDSEIFNSELRINGFSDFDIFPNPVTDLLNINYHNDIFNYTTARIYNSTGQLMQEISTLNQRQSQIDISSYPGGIYLLEMRGESGHRIVNKFMKTD